MKRHIPLPNQSTNRAISWPAAAAEAIATLREEFGLTNDAWISTATSDADEPDEPVVNDEDTYRRRQDEYERGLDYDGRWAS